MENVSKLKKAFMTIVSAVSNLSYSNTALGLSLLHIGINLPTLAFLAVIGHQILIISAVCVVTHLVFG